MKNPIPDQVALEICELVRQRNSKKKLSLAKGQCWGCMKHSTKKNNDKARCFFDDEVKDNRGCQLINKIFDREYSKIE